MELSGLVKDGIVEIHSNGKTTYRIQNKALLRKTLQKEFSKLFSLEHDEDAFLPL